MIDELQRMAGFEFFAYQTAAIEAAQAQSPARARLCLYYKTGAGKTVTGLACVSSWGYDQCLVITPPATFDAWQEWGKNFGITVTCISHARFRMKTTKLSRTTPVIADEFHLFGGHGGKGWQKLDTLGRHLQAPLVLMSATPNYNDAERVYCIQHVLDPNSCKGGYLEFIYAHCNTQQNPFGMQPLVDDDQPFRNFKDAAEYLASLPLVEYLPDDLVYKIHDLPVMARVPLALHQYGLNARKGRIIASDIERRHALVDHGLIEDDGRVVNEVERWITYVMTTTGTPVLIFAQHSSVAEAVHKTMPKRTRVGLVTGKTPAHKKKVLIDHFRAGMLDVLIGTATLATGTDGLDKVCDRLLIVDDTEDDALRRQLVGRIMPRGASSNLADKQVFRLVLS
jgi:superfamily II DNA or RNA helicase